MVKLEDITQGAELRGIEGAGVVRVVTTERVGRDALTVYYKDAEGRLGEQLLFREHESDLDLAETGRAWDFDAPGAPFQLALEAFRIHLAHLFDPMLAVHTSNVEPLPHQISAVYEAMLPRQPLRYVLADDPGAGKTIMAGLLIRELLMRADAQRILVVAPGSLSEQWQDELLEKFGLHFEIFSREKQEQSASSNFFDDQDQVICRLDQIARNDDYQDKLSATHWDLIIVDEAHKLSANYTGQKVNKTKRFQLGELLGSLTRHFLLMTATPHNGKEEDFQIWLSLLDSDRFYGRFREGVHRVDVDDLMRRMVKEDLLKFDGTPLFPERRAYTALYELSDAEAALYDAVTEYVRHEMNRAERLQGNRKGAVGFALTLLQRRLASSPEAIYQSLKRRRKRLQSRLEEKRLEARGRTIRGNQAETTGSYWVKRQVELPESLDDLEDELAPEDYEAYAEAVVDEASAADTVVELEAEIEQLKALEQQAAGVVQSKKDRKWEEMSSLLQNAPEMYTAHGHRRKLIIFTEHKDTLNYLVTRIGGVLGDENAVVTIHGGINRDDRRKTQERFRQDPELLVLVATDAAGEGVNLQHTNLMVNYDLPWNPNRLEQRFGRIHRIGQEEICHLWNVVAKGTREGDVFRKLFDKLEVEREALGGKVFDILGEAFEDKSLKDLLIEAILYNESEEAQARFNRVIDDALDTEHLKSIMQRNALVEQHMNLEDLYEVREQMEKAEARKLQPWFVKSFFEQAFEHLGGELRPREQGRYEIRHVPAAIRECDRVIGEGRTPVLRRYERICFEKDRVRIGAGRPVADLVHPGHPLMRAVTWMILDAHREKLQRGAVLVDPTEESTTPRALVMIDHRVREGGSDQRDVSRRLQFVSIDESGHVGHAGWAPHLDLRPIESQEHSAIEDLLQAEWINASLETQAVDHAARELVPEHFREVKQRREHQADKTLQAVHRRLVKEIHYLEGRATTLREEVRAGKQPNVQPENLERRAEELSARLKQRTRELEAKKQVVSSTPVVVGAALVVPRGLIDTRTGAAPVSADAEARARIEKLAMERVMEAERELGHQVKDVAAEKCGWDITAWPPAGEAGELPPSRHIEVKGRAREADTVTVTRNELLTSFNQGDKYILAIVLVDGDQADGPYYLRSPFDQEPGWAETNRSFKLAELLERAVEPAACR